MLKLFLVKKNRVEGIGFLPIIGWIVCVHYNEETGNIYVWSEPVTPDEDNRGEFIYNTRTKEAFKGGEWWAYDVDEKKLKEFLQREIGEKLALRRKKLNSGQSPA